MPLLDHFGWVAKYYDRFASTPQPDHWVQVMQLPISGHLLDVGGGTGRVSAPIAGFTGGVILADASYEMTRQAGQKPGLWAVQAESEHLPFPNGHFERVMMVDALHHVTDQGQTATELVRILQPGGILIIEEPDIRTILVKGIALMEKLLLMRSHFLAPQRIAALFHGLPVIVQILNEQNTVRVITQKQVNLQS